MEGKLCLHGLLIEWPKLRSSNNFERKSLIFNLRVAFEQFLIEIVYEAKRLEFEVDLRETTVDLGLILRIIPKL